MTHTPATRGALVDDAMVIRACNAYDAEARSDGEDPDQCAQFPWMHAALTAALLDCVPDYPDGTDAEGFPGGDERMAASPTPPASDTAASVQQGEG
jgi:hypothetical protein